MISLILSVLYDHLFFQFFFFILIFVPVSITNSVHLASNAGNTKHIIYSMCIHVQLPNSIGTKSYITVYTCVYTSNKSLLPVTSR